MSAFAGLRPEDHATTKDRFRTAVRLLSLPVVLAVVVALGALGWLLGTELYWVVVGGFILSLVALLVTSVSVVWFLTR